MSGWPIETWGERAGGGGRRRGEDRAIVCMGLVPCGLIGSQIARTNNRQLSREALLSHVNENPLADFGAGRKPKCVAYRHLNPKKTCTCGLASFTKHWLSQAVSDRFGAWISIETNLKPGFSTLFGELAITRALGQPSLTRLYGSPKHVLSKPTESRLLARRFFATNMDLAPSILPRYFWSWKPIVKLNRLRSILAILSSKDTACWSPRQFRLSQKKNSD